MDNKLRVKLYHTSESDCCDKLTMKTREDDTKNLISFQKSPYIDTWIYYTIIFICQRVCILARRIKQYGYRQQLTVTM